MSSETTVGLCTNKPEQEKDKPWVAVKRAAPLAICLVALPALLLTLVGMPSTSRLRWTTLGSTTRQGNNPESRNICVIKLWSSVYGLNSFSGVVGLRFGKKCGMSAGRWVREPRGPIYPNLTCPTIPDSKNCQKYGKDPRHLYWRWQPDGCELPWFAPERFLGFVRRKRLAFIGDSLARNQMESLLCLLSPVLTDNKHSKISPTFNVLALRASTIE